MLPICFAIFGCGLSILVDEPIKHVEEDRGQVIIQIRLYILQIALGRFTRKTLAMAKFIVIMLALVFRLCACIAFRLSRLLLEVQVEKSGMVSPSIGNRKNL